MESICWVVVRMVVYRVAETDESCCCNDVRLEMMTLGWSGGGGG